MSPKLFKVCVCVCVCVCGGGGGGGGERGIMKTTSCGNTILSKNSFSKIFQSLNLQNLQNTVAGKFTSILNLHIHNKNNLTCILKTSIDQ